MQVKSQTEKKQSRVRMFQVDNMLAIDVTKKESEDTHPDDIYLTPENLARTTYVEPEESKEEP